MNFQKDLYKIKFRQLILKSEFRFHIQMQEEDKSDATYSGQLIL